MIRGPAPQAVLAGLDAILPALDSFYLDLHQHPELSLCETRTAARMAGSLADAGLEVAPGVGGNGVVALLRNGDGPTVMIRADMDALPIREETGAPYASTGEAMHACGHDVHSTCLLGAAHLLAAHRASWRGTLLAVAQPAEEIFQGAGPMLRDGLYGRFPRPDVVLGQHTWPLLMGTIAHRPGALMSAGTSLDITIFGQGGHGSRPEAAIDPVVIAASIVMRLQSIVAREIRPGEPAVLTVGKLHAGTQANIIPDSAILGVNIRSYRDEVQQFLLEAIRRIVRAECQAGRCPREPEIAFANGAPALVNDPAAVARVRAAHAAWFGPDQVLEADRLMATEDFSLYGRPEAGGYAGDPVPLVYWLLGVLDRRQWDQAPGTTPEEKLCHVPGVHSPRYLPARPGALRAGTEALVVAALACFA